MYKSLFTSLATGYVSPSLIMSVYKQARKQIYLSKAKQKWYSIFFHLLHFIHSQLLGFLHIPQWMHDYLEISSAISLHTYRTPPVNLVILF